MRTLRICEADTVGWQRKEGCGAAIFCRGGVDKEEKQK